VFGILLMGFGLSLLGDAITLKIESSAWTSWFLSGTFALICIFAGLSFFGQATIFKSQIDRKKKKKKRKH
jgi:di/tricarboxylate transporter